MRQQQKIGAVAALDDPMRRRLLQLVGDSTLPVSRDAAAATLSVSRSTVAFHLDRLVEAGLLVVAYERVNGLTGPGSGRPAKVYSRAPGELNVSIPERHYDLMGDLLATAVENADDADSALDALRAAATTAGREAGRAAGTLEQVLYETGYEPVPGPERTTLGNCPFHSLARRHTEVVCAANEAFLRAAVEEVGSDPAKVVLEPTGSGCCVWIKA